MHWLRTWCVFSFGGLGEDNSIGRNLHGFFPIVMAFGLHFSSYYHYTTNQMWWHITIVHGYLSKFYINFFKNLYPWLWHVLKVTTILWIQPHPTPKLLFKSLLLLFKKIIVLKKNSITIGLIRQKNTNANKKTLLTSWNWNLEKSNFGVVSI